MTSDRAPPGRPAGIVSRALASAIDLVVVMIMCGGLLLAVAGIRLVLSPLSFRWPSPGWVLSLLVAVSIATGYLAIAWATTGRTCGAAVLGLRVRSAGGGPLGWARAGLRGALCAVFPIGLVWVVISPRRRSVQDLLVHSAVIYDWRDDAELQKVLGSAKSPVTDGWRELAPGQRSDVADNGRKSR
jgi:uncharacterized RDD family membrane protein YckC